MKNHSFLLVVTMVVLVLAIAVEEVQLVSNYGRRFGRSLKKKHNLRNKFERQEKFNSSPLVQNGYQDGNPFHEYPLVAREEQVGWYKAGQKPLSTANCVDDRKKNQSKIPLRERRVKHHSKTFINFLSFAKVDWTVKQLIWIWEKEKK